jgi:hypothetical protein
MPRTQTDARAGRAIDARAVRAVERAQILDVVAAEATAGDEAQRPAERARQGRLADAIDDDGVLGGFDTPTEVRAPHAGAALDGDTPLTLVRA